MGFVENYIKELIIFIYNGVNEFFKIDSLYNLDLVYWEVLNWWFFKMRMVFKWVKGNFLGVIEMICIIVIVVIK